MTALAEDPLGLQPDVIAVWTGADLLAHNVAHGSY
jgi:hypothetical protein